MTIAAAYLVSEGVVLGADSSTAVSIRSPDGKSRGVLQVLGHAQKVYEIGEKSRFGVCTWGAGRIGEISHRTIIARLADGIKDDTTVESLSHILGNSVESLIQNIPNFDFVGYYLGGWDNETHIPSCFQIEIKKGEKHKVTPIRLGTCSFSGNPLFFARVFRGFDPRLPETLLVELKKLFQSDLLPKDFDRLFNEAFNKSTIPLLAAGHQDLPIREAIDFIHSYLHITVKAVKFSFGAPLAGGPIEIGFVSSDRRFRWVKHKKFSSAIIEGEDEYDI
jgi:hypothetical protein